MSEQMLLGKVFCNERRSASSVRSWAWMAIRREEVMDGMGE
jgi:hypothetical protein